MVYRLNTAASRFSLLPLLRSARSFLRRLDALLREVHAKRAPDRFRLGDAVLGLENALAESIIGLFKTEVIQRKCPWRHLEAVEFATLDWVDWFNHRRLLEPIGYVPPAEYEARFYDQPAA